MKALDKYILIVLFVILLKIVHFLAFFKIYLARETCSGRLKRNEYSKSLREKTETITEHQTRYLDCRQTFPMFSLPDQPFVLCSRDLDAVPRAQRIMGFSILITHKSTGSENPIQSDYGLTWVNY